MSKKKPNRETTEITKPYEPTPDECAAWEAVRARRKRTPHLKVSVKGNVADLSLDHPDQSNGHYILMDALGTSELAFYDEILAQLSKAATQGEKVDERALNFIASVIKGVEPKDQLETMLAAQMAAVHMLTMNFAHRLNNVATIPQQDSAERAGRESETLVKPLKLRPECSPRNMDPSSLRDGSPGREFLIQEALRVFPGARVIQGGDAYETT